MVGKSRNILAISILLIAVAITSIAAFGQATEPIQLAANTTPQTVSKPPAELAPSAAALQARIDAQQQEINRLTTLVEKLQTTLQPIASAQPVWPNGSVGYLPPAGTLSGSPAPVPAPEPAATTSSTPRELLPDIGHIGAELGFFVGGATNPYKDNNGFATGGFIDLPWKNVPAGKLSYEIMIGLQRSTTTQTSTSGVNVLVNTALNNYLVAAGVESLPTLTNYLAGPLPALSQTVQERAKVMTVAPFELKYTITKLGRFRPYGVVGLGAYVWIGSESNVGSFNANTALGSLANLAVGSSTLGNTLNALLQGSQIGGLAPTSPELAARGVPHGQGNLLFGAQVGGGFEFRVTPKLSWGADFRRNQVEGTNASFNTFAFKQGLHW
jgi:opacity protein-like surface antigen